MAKNWKDHPAVGVQVNVEDINGNEYKATVVDVKLGPLVTAIDSLESESMIRSTLKLKVRPVGGRAVDDHWLPPMDGNKLLKMLEDLRIKNENY